MFKPYYSVTMMCFVSDLIHLLFLHRLQNILRNVALFVAVVTNEPPLFVFLNHLLETEVSQTL